MEAEAQLCICGHDRVEHLQTDPGGSSGCLHNGCNCTGWRVATDTAISIHTRTNDNTGVTVVQFEIGSSSINLTPDAAAHVGLELVAAAYAARSEQAMWHWKKKEQANAPQHESHS